MYFIVFLITFIVFVYFIGLVHGSRTEKGKQNEKELDTVRRACSARTNANVERLRSKYKRNTVRND